MALCALSDDALGVIYVGLINVLDPGVAVDFSSASKGLWEPTQAMRQQLRTDHEAAVVLCRKVGLGGCKALRDANRVSISDGTLSVVELTLLGSLGAVLPALETLSLIPSARIAGPDGVQRLAERLGVGALPAVTNFYLFGVHVGDAGASAIAAALGRGALPRLKILTLNRVDIGDVGLVALAPALRRLPALETLDLEGNRFGDEGITALLAPPPPAGASSPTTGVLTKLEVLNLSTSSAKITNAGCAALATALTSGALPALRRLLLYGVRPVGSVAANLLEAARRQRVVFMF